MSGNESDFKGTIFTSSTTDISRGRNSQVNQESDKTGLLLDNNRNNNNNNNNNVQKRNNVSTDSLNDEYLGLSDSEILSPDNFDSPLLRQNNISNSSKWKVLILIIFTILGTSIFFASNASFFEGGNLNSYCEMTWMRPKYIPLDDFKPSSNYLNKYKLYLYKENDGRSKENEPSGVPVLFIPGNAGIYKQGRSLGSVLHQKYFDKIQSMKNIEKIDLFLLDNNEELSAFEDHFLTFEAEFANDAVNYILSQYKVRNVHDTPPSSVIMIAHSMGGVVSMIMPMLPNHRKGSINTIVTFASPLSRPPVPVDWSIVSLYNRIHDFWRFGMSSDEKQYDYLKQISIISIAGGILDTMVYSGNSELRTFIPLTNGITVFTTGIKNVWTTCDHKSILWCNQLLRTVSDVLFNILDKNLPQRTIDLPKRMEVFDNGLRAWMASPPTEPWNNSPTFPHGNTDLVKIISKLPFILSNEEKDNDELIYPDQSTFIIPVPDNIELEQFVIMSNKIPGVETFNIMACNADLTVEDISLTRDCHSLNDAMKMASYSIRDIPRQYILNANTRDLSGKNAIVIERRSNTHSGYIFADFYSLLKNTFTEHVSTLESLNKFKKVIEINNARTILHFPRFDSSFIRYKMNFKSICNDDKKELFPPFLHQTVSGSSEELFHSSKDTSLITYFSDDYIHSPKALPGVFLEIWASPTCNKLEIDFKFDFYGSLGATFAHTNMAWVSMSLGLIVFILGNQLTDIKSSRSCYSLLTGIFNFIQNDLISYLIIFVFIGFFQKLFAERLLWIPESLRSMILPIFFGYNSTWTPLLPPLFFLLSIGFLLFILLCSKLVTFIISIPFIIIMSITKSPLRFSLRKQIILYSFFLISVLLFLPYHLITLLSLIHVIISISIQKARYVSFKNSKLTDVKKNISILRLEETIFLFHIFVQTFGLPVLGAWAKNLLVQKIWYGNHGIFTVLPLLVYTIIISNWKSFVHQFTTKELIVAKISCIIFSWICFLLGTTFTYSLYHICSLLFLILILTTTDFRIRVYELIKPYI